MLLPIAQKHVQIQIKVFTSETCIQIDVLFEVLFLNLLFPVFSFSLSLSLFLGHGQIKILLTVRHGEGWLVYLFGRLGYGKIGDINRVYLFYFFFSVLILSLSYYSYIIHTHIMHICSVFNWSWN